MSALMSHPPPHDQHGPSRGPLGFESELWRAADLLRNNMDPAQYKHIVLGLLFLKYVGAVHAAGRDTAAPVFSVPKEARWSYLREYTGEPDPGERLNRAMSAIERANPTLTGALPQVYTMPGLTGSVLQSLIELISGIGIESQRQRPQDALGRVYEYFLSRFASAEGKGGGQFYTPSSVVRLLVAMLEPHRGRVYDPCCGSGGMFVQSLAFHEAHRGRRDALVLYGQESNPTTWRMARMNLAIRGIEGLLGETHADTFRRDLHPDLRADYILANPPFNVSVWHRDERDERWAYGVPPRGNANFAWVQHIVHHLAPDGAAGFVLANSSMFSKQSGEGEIRRKLVEAGLVDCIVACPGQLFYATQIPVCLWFLRKGRSARRDQVLFIDARPLGRMETRVHRVLDQADIDRLSSTYHSWRAMDAVYRDVPGFCRSADIWEIAEHDHLLTPGRYVGTAPANTDDDTPISEQLQRLATRYREQCERSRQLDSRLLHHLEQLTGE